MVPYSHPDPFPAVMSENESCNEKRAMTAGTRQPAEVGCCGKEESKLLFKLFSSGGGP